MINMSIQQRIRWSFTLLVALFVVNGLITILTLNNNKKLSSRLSKVVEPSLQSLDEFKEMMLKSKMYSTNWVFLRYKQEDKDMLKSLHDVDYANLKKRINNHTSKWENKNWIDTLGNVYAGFEQLLDIEKTLMNSLKTFTDYDDPVIKLEAERLVEDEILPRTGSLMARLENIHAYGVQVRQQENTKLERSSEKLRFMIIILTLTIILAGILLARHMMKIIIAPVNHIRRMINDLGKGIIRKVEHKNSEDEIGKMVSSVNNLAISLEATASFAQEIGRRNFDMPFKPLSEEDTLGKSLIAMRDNLRTSDANLEIQNRELERKNKELEQFAYVASHDLQEPLRTTSGFVNLFQQQYKGKLDAKADKYLSYIVQASNRMQVLITDLLEYSRIGNKKELEQVDCNQMLKEVVCDLDARIQESGAEIHVGPLPVINCFPTEVKLLFQNLIVNAIKFRRKDVPPQVLIGALRKGNGWEFSVADNGIGIAKEHHDRIFIIFQRLHTRSEYSGSGIGLSHCKKIVELHKGKIWINSTPGKGTTFHFTLHQTRQAVNEGATNGVYKHE
jgi:signal transduction histidine kinase